MVLVWVLQEIFMLFAYYNLEAIPDVRQAGAEEKSEDNSRVGTRGMQNKPLLVNDSLDDSVFDKQINGYGNYPAEQDRISGVISSDNFVGNSGLGDVVGPPRCTSVTRSRTKTPSVAKLVETLEVSKGE